MAIAWSIDNPVGKPAGKDDKRVNEFRGGGELAGIADDESIAADSDVLRGSFALAS